MQAEGAGQQRPVQRQYGDGVVDVTRLGRDLEQFGTVRGSTSQIHNRWLMQTMTDSVSESDP
jgi:hypothetical protein